MENPPGEKNVRTAQKEPRYPDPTDFDELLYSSLSKLPCGRDINLDFLKEHIWSEVKEFNIPRSKVIRGMQANMFAIEMSNGDKVVRTVLVKRIVPVELPEKASIDSWREFVHSVRSEIDFYAKLKNEDAEGIGSLFPKVYYSAGSNPSLDHDSPKETSFVLIMEDLSDCYYQTPEMNESEAKLVMDSLAKLHVHYWGKVDNVERGGFWVFKRRQKLGEVDHAVNTWNQLVDRFPQLEQEVPDVRRLGSLIKDKAEYLDNIAANGAYTRIHGDAKGWNLFLGKPTAPNPVAFIDLQWTGKGHPLQDVAYTLTTSLRSDDLPKMDSLVDHYVSVLSRELNSRDIQPPANLRSEYDLIWMDYARVIMTGLWKNLNPVSIETNKAKVGPSMINRSWEHVLFITKRIARLLPKL